jgi:hypothetical protein
MVTENSDTVDVKIVHVILIVAVLLFFSHLSFDALILGTAAVYLYQRSLND